MHDDSLVISDPNHKNNISSGTRTRNMPMFVMTGPDGNWKWQRDNVATNESSRNTTTGGRSGGK